MRHSTNLLDEHRRNAVAKLHMSYYYAIVKIAKENGGQIRSFNGDSLLVFFIGKNNETVQRAVKSAFRMKYAISEIVNPVLKNYIDIDFGIGMDVGSIVATKVGVGGDETTKDLIWLGDAVNRATKISDECSSPENVGISESVFGCLSNDCLMTSNNDCVWSGGYMKYNMNEMAYYKSTCYIEIQ